MTMKGCPSMSSMSWMVQMPGWLSWEAARASRRKRSSDLRSFDQVLGNELQGDVAAQARVFRLVHHPHAATAELAHNVIVGDCLADHPRTSDLAALMLGR